MLQNLTFYWFYMINSTSGSLWRRLIFMGPMSVHVLVICWSWLLTICWSGLQPTSWKWMRFLCTHGVATWPPSSQGVGLTAQSLRSQTRNRCGNVWTSSGAWSRSASTSQATWRAIFGGRLHCWRHGEWWRQETLSLQSQISQKPICCNLFRSEGSLEGIIIFGYRTLI